MARIAVVKDGPSIADLVSLYLRHEGHEEGATAEIETVRSFGAGLILHDTAPEPSLDETTQRCLASLGATVETSGPASERYGAALGPRSAP